VIAVARNVNVFGSGGGKPIAHVDDGEVLERREDTPLRMLTSDGVFETYPVRIRTPHGVVEGYVPVEREQVGRGLGLFVGERSPILGRSAPIGTAHRGAFVPLVRFEADMAVVALPPFKTEGRIPRAALTAAGLPAPDPRPAEMPLENRNLTMKVDGDTIVTVCSEPIALGEVRGNDVLVSQTVPGIEIAGLAQGEGTACRPRAIVQDSRKPTPPVPDGWVVPSPEPRGPFARSRDLYRVNRDEPVEGVCSKWSVQLRGKQARLTTTFLAKTLFTNELLRTTDTYLLDGSPSLAATPSTVMLELESTVTRDMHGKKPEGFGEGVSLCVWTISVVGETPDGITVLDPSPGEPIVAYNPADADVWYTRKDTCERAATAERAAAAQRPKPLARLLAPASRGGC
jgi:hypothetical protein